MGLIICSVVHAKRAGGCSKSVAGGGRRAASLLSTDIMVVECEKAVWLKLCKLHESEAYEFCCKRCRSCIFQMMHAKFASLVSKNLLHIAQ